MRDQLKQFAARLSAAPIRKTSSVLACLGLSVTVISSCGILGEKEKANLSLSQGNTACLDELGPLTEEFLNGTVSESKWRSTWDCVDDTIDLFKTYVKGSEANGYNATDIRLLTQKFLFAKKTVTTKLVDGALNIKAALFGGSETKLSNGELDQFRTLARFMKEETSRLIPHLRNRKVNPTAQNMRAFADAISEFGDRFAVFLNTTPNRKLTTEKALQFITELSAISTNADSEKLTQWTRSLQEVKVLLVRGETDGIAGQDWTKLFKLGFRAGGAFIAYLELKDEDPLFELEMTERIHGVLKTSLADWGGIFPFAQFEKIIDQLPAAIFPGVSEEFRNGLKKALHPRNGIANGKTTVYRPGAARLLRSKSDLGMDVTSLDSLLTTFRTGSRGRFHLNRIYADRKDDLSSADFETIAKQYSAGLTKTEQDEVTRLIILAKRYLGYHPNESNEMLFGDMNRHSKNNLSKINWYELAASFLLDAYGSRSNAFGKAGNIADLEVLVGDINPILFASQMIHPLRMGTAAKRFREANLFTQAGNGDDLMDLPEATIYFSFLFSATLQADRMLKSSLLGDHPCQKLGWNVPLRLAVYDIHCFRDRFMASYHDNLSSMPKMQDEIAGMTVNERDQIYSVLENAGKMTGYDANPITKFDVTTYAGISHFVESAFFKFDRNKDGTLDRSETLEVAFPVFKRELATMSKIKIDFVNKAVLLYLMQYGKEPKMGDLLKWAISFQFLKKFNARRIRVYQIFAALSPPSVLDPISQTPPPGATDSSALGFIAESMMRGLTPVFTEEVSISGSSNLALKSNFDLSKVDPVQLQGYPAEGPVIDPDSPHQEALEVLPQDL